MLGNEETRPAGSGCDASPQSLHRELEVRGDRDQALQSRRKSEPQPAMGSQQILLFQNVADWGTTLQTGMLRQIYFLFLKKGDFMFLVYLK